MLTNNDGTYSVSPNGIFLYITADKSVFLRLISGGNHPSSINNYQIIKSVY